MLRSQPDRLRPRVLASFAVLSVAVGLPACGPAASSTDPLERSDSAGVAIVVNSGVDRGLGWTYAPVRSIGGELDGPEAFFNVGTGAIAASDDGLLYVLDRGSHRIVVFDGEGRHVRTMGRRGDGPGEIQYPGWLVLGGDGSVAVTDFGKRGLARFAPDGEPLQPFRIEANWFGGRIASSTNGYIVQLMYGDAEVSHHGLRLFGDADTVMLATVTQPRGRPVDFGCVHINAMPPVFMPDLVWAPGRDAVAIAAWTDYVIEVYDGARLASRIRRDIPPRPATRELGVREIGDGMQVRTGAGDCVVPPERVVDERGLADYVPAIRSMAFAPDGTLWVRRYAVRGEDAAIDLFEPDGAYIGTLPPGFPFPAAFLPDDEFASVEKDDFDIERIVINRIER